MMSSTDIIAINCLMAGDPSTLSFTVDIASNKTISLLKNKIQEVAQLPYPVPDINLFKVPPTPVTSDPLEIESDASPLPPLAMVSHVFDILDAGKVHVIVLPPCKLLLGIDIHMLD